MKQLSGWVSLLIPFEAAGLMALISSSSSHRPMPLPPLDQFDGDKKGLTLIVEFFGRISVRCERRQQVPFGHRCRRSARSWLRTLAWQQKTLQEGGTLRLNRHIGSRNGLIGRLITRFTRLVHSGSGLVSPPPATQVIDWSAKSAVATGPAEKASESKTASLEVCDWAS